MLWELKAPPPLVSALLGSCFQEPSNFRGHVGARPAEVHLAH